MNAKRNPQQYRIIEERREEPDLRLLAKVLLALVLHAAADDGEGTEELAS